MFGINRSNVYSFSKQASVYDKENQSPNILNNKTQQVAQSKIQATPPTTSSKKKGNRRTGPRQESVINYFNIQCIEPDKERPTKRIKYSYVSNQTASIELAKGKVATNEDVCEHAYRRVQHVYGLLKKIYKTAQRSDGRPGNVDVRIEHAPGQGGASTVENYHASHDTFCAGFEENRFFHIMREINIDMQMTPKKRSLLKEAGMPEDVIKFIEDNIENPVVVSSIFWMHLPYLHLLSQENRKIHQATTCLPREINLIVDKRLEEYIRSKAPAKFVECMQGLKTPEQVCKEIVELMRKHFEKTLDQLKDRKKNLLLYKEKVKECFKLEEAYKRKESFDLEDYKNKIKKLESIKKDLDVYKKKVSKPFDLLKLTHFLNPSIERLDGIDIDEFTSIESKYREVIYNTNDLYDKLLRWNLQELQGTTTSNLF